MTATIDNATDYAMSVAKSIWEDTEAGHPFGYDEERLEYGEDAELSAWDYLENALDVNYTIGSDMEYRWGRVTIAYGGPNAYIDTGSHELIVYWGLSEARENLPSKFINQLDEALAEDYDNRR